VLVPLFGVHYTVFLGMSYITGVHPGVQIAWLFCDQLFASFQVRQKLVTVQFTSMTIAY
jgi:parathyroid hormone receptor 1